MLTRDNFTEKRVRELQCILVDIDETKVEIESKLPTSISEKTINYAVALYLKCGKHE